MKIQVEKIATLAGHKDCVYSLEHSPDARYFFSADGKGLIAQWDLEQPEIGKLIAQVPASVYAMRLLPERQQLLIGQNFEGLHLIDLQQKKEQLSLKLTDAAIFDIQIVGDEAYIALGDGVLAVVDLAHWAVRKHLKASEKSARCIAISPDGQDIAIGFSDHSIRVFERQSLQPKQLLTGHSNSVFTLTYSPCGKYLLSGSRDAHLKVWEVHRDYALAHSIVAHMYALNHIAYHPSGAWFATASMDKSLKVWDAQQFKLLKVIDKARHAGHGTSVNKLLWTGFRDYIVSASDDRSVSVWALDLAQAHPS
jgi:WD40 repeat protein